MSDYSLMNPDHLKSEIHNMEELVAKNENTVKELQEDLDRVIDTIRESHNEGQSTTLTFEQTRDVIETLQKFNHNIFVLSTVRKFHLRVYNRLLTDRRWIIGSKLRFLKK